MSTPPTSTTSLDELFAPPPARHGEAFATSFRGYDRDEVDRAIAAFMARQQADAERLAQLDRHRQQALAGATGDAERIAALQAELTVAQAQAARAEKHVRTLTGELADGAKRGDGDRSRFEEVLRVAEEQASQIIKNASVQGERLILAANEEIAKRKADAKADAEAVMSRARHDEHQIRLRIATEMTAHEALLEQQAAHSAERVTQADQEAATVRTEAERAAAALRALVTRETEQQRARAEEAVRELRLRALEFDESLTRRQDDAQQEFLMLHNQAVAHAERITRDANDQVAASIDHAQRVSAKAADFDRVMRAQAAQIEAEAQARAGEILDRAQSKAQRIIDTVAGHSQAVLRDAEDRARALRWQGHQLASFMAEVHELIRPEASDDDEQTSPVEDDSEPAETSRAQEAAPDAETPAPRPAREDGRGGVDAGAGDIVPPPIHTADPPAGGAPKAAVAKPRPAVPRSATTTATAAAPPKKPAGAAPA